METERILLRHWQESDAEALFKYASDPNVGPRAGWPAHKSVEESREIIRTFFHNDTTWAIIWKETGEAIGCIGYYTHETSNIPIGENDCEDVVELQCHGGPLVLRQVLGLTYRLGAQPAEPGEFTKRAFLNGRLDLSQAQSVMDVIQARTASIRSIWERISRTVVEPCISPMAGFINSAMNPWNAIKGICRNIAGENFSRYGCCKITICSYLRH